MSDRLASINRELEAFSYSVSHDLRAPFRHIVGYAQLLKKFEGDRLSERGNRFVDTVIESAISAGTLVDDLLSFSQMGRATLMPIAIDFPRTRARAVRLGRKLSRSMAASTAARFSGWTGLLPVSTRETVLGETLARRAISLTVGCLVFIGPCGLEIVF